MISINKKFSLLNEGELYKTYKKLRKQKKKEEKEEKKQPSEDPYQNVDWRNMGYNIGGAAKGLSG